MPVIQESKVESYYCILDVCLVILKAGKADMQLICSYTYLIDTLHNYTQSSSYILAHSPPQPESTRVCFIYCMHVLQ